MGTSCSFSINIQSLSTFLIFLMMLSSTHARFMPQGGSSFKPIDKNLQMERRNLLIGSRPPRCEKRYCIKCGHCEAVQVPIVPKIINTTQQASSLRILQDFPLLFAEKNFLGLIKYLR
ncbi:hypothetical protein M8C21_026286 [Ambrosia artemisiifolia]|uniref:Epidermal patterning factor-like protein n=1 Tax=Ambrosia artemisiifolia TaxID=4212 RepID=A0AAD5GR36_AMBAR|nr:hypothetical protein M8C21_026286 [Ambrosia artemisiifolia]